MKTWLSVFISLVLCSLIGCGTIAPLPVDSPAPEPGKFNIYLLKKWGDGVMVHGQIMADNLSPHDFGGQITCNWSASGALENREVKDFELKSMAKQPLDFSTMVAGNRGERMRLQCDITYLVCHDCGEKVVINK